MHLQQVVIRGDFLSPRIPEEPHRSWLKPYSEPPARENLDGTAAVILPQPWRTAIPIGIHEPRDQT